MDLVVEVVTGPMADLLARAQLDVMRDICAWVAQRRARDAGGSDAANDVQGPAEPD